MNCVKTLIAFDIVMLSEIFETVTLFYRRMLVKTSKHLCRPFCVHTTFICKQVSEGTFLA